MLQTVWIVSTNVVHGMAQSRSRDSSDWRADTFFQDAIRKNEHDHGRPTPSAGRPPGVRRRRTRGDTAEERVPGMVSGMVRPPWSPASIQCVMSPYLHDVWDGAPTTTRHDGGNLILRGFPLLSVCRHPPPHPGKSGERLHRARSGESYSDVDSEHGGGIYKGVEGNPGRRVGGVIPQTRAHQGNCRVRREPCRWVLYREGLRPYRSMTPRPRALFTLMAGPEQRGRVLRDHDRCPPASPYRGTQNPPDRTRVVATCRRGAVRWRLVREWVSFRKIFRIWGDRNG